MTLTLLSPLQGWAGPLAELPDAAFAEGMVGDGVAIDPTGTTLHAPCAGIDQQGGDPEPCGTEPDLAYHFLLERQARVAAGDKYGS